MSKVKKRTFEREYVQVPNETAQAPQVNINKMLNENAIPLESLGLLINLWSYDYEKFELHKTEIYKRFAYNKETSVKRAWKFLMDAGYMIEFKYREGNRWEFVYIFNILPYTDEQKAIILEESRLEYGDIRGLENEDLNSKTPKGSPQTPEISNTLLKQDLTKAKQTKTKDKNLVNKGLENLPEKNLLEKNAEIKKEFDPSTENFDWRSQQAKMQKEFSERLANKRKEHKENPQSDYDWSEPYGNWLMNVANEFYAEFSVNRWSKKQWQTIVSKLSIDIVSSGVEIDNHRGYIYNCLKKIAYSHDLKHGKIEPDFGNLPFHYNWLEGEEE